MSSALLFVMAIIFEVLMLTHQSLIPESRVVNGQNVNQVIPFMAYLEIHPYRLAPIHCGGALIGDRYVLTAAHCLTDFRAGSVILNSNTWDDYKLPITSISITIDSVKIHEKFNESIQGRFDIGIVFLVRTVEPEKVRPVVYANKILQKHYNIRTVMFYGWGQTDLTNNPKTAKPMYLKSGSFNILDYHQCEKVLDKLDLDNELKDAFIGSAHTYCLKDLTQGKILKDSGGKGDSGSPLLYEIERVGHAKEYLPPCYLLVGVYGGGYKRAIDFGTDVTHFYEWISDVKKEYQRKLDEAD